MEECDLAIYSTSGKKVFSETKQKGSVLVPVSHLKPGVYILILQNEEKLVTERFVVE